MTSSLTVVPPAGSRLRGSVLAALFAEARPLVAYKPANEVVNGSTTLQDDDDLFWPVAANARYSLRLILYMNSGATPDFKFAWSVPSGTTIIWSTIALSPTAVTNLTGPLNEGTTAVYDGQGALRPIYIDGLVRVGPTSGTLGIQWAQNSSNASDTIVAAGSFGTLLRVG